MIPRDFLLLREQPAFPEQPTDDQTLRGALSHGLAMGLSKLEWMTGMALAAGESSEHAVIKAIRAFDELESRRREAIQESKTK